MYTYAHHMIASSGCAVGSTSQIEIMLIPGSETIRTICRKKWFLENQQSHSNVYLVGGLEHEFYPLVK